MDRYRLAALKKAFSFLSELEKEGSPDNASEIRLARGDRNLMDRKGGRKGNEKNGQYTTFHVVYETELNNQITLKTERLSTGNHSAGKNELSNATIGEELFSKGWAPEYIVERIRSSVDGKEEISWTIFDMTEFDLVAYHRHEMAHATATLKAEMADVRA